MDFLKWVKDSVESQIRQIFLLLSPVPVVPVDRSHCIVFLCVCRMFYFLLFFTVEDEWQDELACLEVMKNE